MQIFISYSRANLATAQRLYEDLMAARVKSWFDQTDLRVGSPNWQRALEDAIEASDAIVCLASPEALESEYVHAELEHGVLHHKPIVFVRIGGPPTDDARFRPRDYRHARVFRIRHDDDYPNVIFRRLLPHLARLLDFRYVVPERAVTVTNDRLSATHPRDYARLLHWIWIDPPRLQLYAERSGWDVVSRPGAWIASTCLWLPFLFFNPDLPGMVTVSPPLRTALLLLAWAVTGLLGMRDCPRCALAPALSAGALLVAAQIGVMNTYGRLESFFLAVPLALALGAGLALLLTLHYSQLDMDIDTGASYFITGTLYLLIGGMALGMMNAIADMDRSEFTFALAALLGFAGMFSQHQQDILDRVLGVGPNGQRVWGALAVMFVTLVMPAILLDQRPIYDQLFWRMYAPAVGTAVFALASAGLIATSIRHLGALPLKLTAAAALVISYGLLVGLYGLDGWERLI